MPTFRRSAPASSSSGDPRSSEGSPPSFLFLHRESQVCILVGCLPEQPSQPLQPSSSSFSGDLLPSLIWCTRCQPPPDLPWLRNIPTAPVWGCFTSAATTKPPPDLYTLSTTISGCCTSVDHQGRPTLDGFGKWWVSFAPRNVFLFLVHSRVFRQPPPPPAAVAMVAAGGNLVLMYFLLSICYA